MPHVNRISYILLDFWNTWVRSLPGPCYIGLEFCARIEEPVLFCHYQVKHMMDFVLNGFAEFLLQYPPIRREPVDGYCLVIKIRYSRIRVFPTTRAHGQFWVVSQKQDNSIFFPKGIEISDKLSGAIIIFNNYPRQIKCQFPDFIIDAKFLRYYVFYRPVFQ